MSTVVEPEAVTVRNAPLVALGRLQATPAALSAFDEAVCADVERPITSDELPHRRERLLKKVVQRHHQGDWGDVSDDDWLANNEARDEGGRILSAYRLSPGGTRVWVITEADRSFTTVLLPDEY